MIPRYARPDAVAIWSPETRYKIWFEIEAHAADAMAELGTIPKAAAEAIWAGGKDAVWDADRIDEIERTTKHDVIAFLTHVSEVVGPEARFLHQGMTSSDVLDTCLAVQMSRATDLLCCGGRAGHARVAAAGGAFPSPSNMSEHLIIYQGSSPFLIRHGFDFLQGRDSVFQSIVLFVRYLALHCDSKLDGLDLEKSKICGFLAAPGYFTQ